MFCAKWSGWRVPSVLELAKLIVEHCEEQDNCIDGKQSTIAIPTIYIKQLKIAIE